MSDQDAVDLVPPSDFKIKHIPPIVNASPAPPRWLKYQVYTDTNVFSSLDEHALKVARRDYDNFGCLIYNLVYSRPFSALERLRLIFRWLTARNLQNISFKDSSEAIPPGSPEDILIGFRYRRSTYSKIFEAMCLAAGIPCTLISGVAKGIEYRPGVKVAQYRTGSKIEKEQQYNHSWNAVYIDNSWQLIDVQWGTRFLQSSADIHSTERSGSDNLVYEYDDFYFMPDPSHLIYSHYPDDSAWQLMPNRVDFEVFQSLPLAKSHFFMAELQFWSHNTGVVQATNGRLKLSIGFWKPVGFTFKMWDVETLSQVTPDGTPLNRYALQELGDGIVNYYIKCPYAGSFYFSIFVQRLDEMEVGQPAVYNAACEYKVVADRAATDRNGSRVTPFPEMDATYGYGSSLYYYQYGLVPSFKAGVVQASALTNDFQLTFAKTKEPKVFFRLRPLDDVSGNTELPIDIRDTSQLAKVTGRLPEEGDYILEVYANTPAIDGDNYTHIGQYLVVAGQIDLPDFKAGLPQTSPAGFARYPDTYELQSSKPQSRLIYQPSFGAKQLPKRVQMIVPSPGKPAASDQKTGPVAVQPSSNGSSKVSVHSVPYTSSAPSSTDLPAPPSDWTGEDSQFPPPPSSLQQQQRQPGPSVAPKPNRSTPTSSPGLGRKQFGSGQQSQPSKEPQQLFPTAKVDISFDEQPPSKPKKAPFISSPSPFYSKQSARQQEVPASQSEKVPVSYQPGASEKAVGFQKAEPVSFGQRGSPYGSQDNLIGRSSPQQSRKAPFSYHQPNPSEVPVGSKVMQSVQSDRQGSPFRQHVGDSSPAQRGSPYGSPYGSQQDVTGSSKQPTPVPVIYQQYTDGSAGKDPVSAGRSGSPYGDSRPSEVSSTSQRVPVSYQGQDSRNIPEQSSRQQTPGGAIQGADFDKPTRESQQVSSPEEEKPKVRTYSPIQEQEKRRMQAAQRNLTAQLAQQAEQSSSRDASPARLNIDRKQSFIYKPEKFAITSNYQRPSNAKAPIAPPQFQITPQKPAAPAPSPQVAVASGGLDRLINEELERYDDHHDVFSNVDRHAFEVARAQHMTFRDLVWDLIYAQNISDDLEKVRALFLWLCTKDLSTMKFQDVTPGSPEEALMGLKSGSQTYAAVFEMLCSFAGLHCVTISGFAKGVDYQPGMRFEGREALHSWNAVLVDGHWRLVDTHWAARRMVGRRSMDNLRYELDEFFFLTSPRQLIYTHFPHDPSWQLLETRLTLAEFENLPPVKSLFFKLGLKFVADAGQAVLPAPYGERNVQLQFNRADSASLDFNYALTTDDGRDEYNVTNAVASKLNRFVLFEIISSNLASFTLRLPSSGSYRFVVFATPKSKKQTIDKADRAFSAVCEWKVNSSRSATNPVPFPSCSSQRWGPALKALAESRGITDLPLDARVYTNSLGIAEIHLKKVNPNQPIVFAGKLKSFQGYDESVLDTAVLYRLVGSEKAVFSISAPGRGEFGLDIFTTRPDESEQSGSKSGQRTLFHLCQYLVLCEEPTVSGLRFPSLPAGYLGAQRIFHELGLSTISHHDPFIVVSDANSELEIEFGLPRDGTSVRAVASLIRLSAPHAGATTEDFSEWVLHQTPPSDDRMVFVCRFPKSGTYKLQVFAQSNDSAEQSDSIPGVYNYLIDVARTPIRASNDQVIPFPRQYSQWHEGGFLLLPIDGVLMEHVVGNRLLVRVAVPRARKVAAVVSDTWTHLVSANDGVWEGVVVLDKVWTSSNEKARRLAISANFLIDSPNAYSTLLEYKLSN